MNKSTKWNDMKWKASFKNLNQQNWKGIARESKRTNTKVFILLTIKVNRPPYPYSCRFGVPFHAFSFFSSSLLFWLIRFVFPHIKQCPGGHTIENFRCSPMGLVFYIPKHEKQTQANTLWLLGRCEHVEPLDLVTVECQVLCLRGIRMHSSNSTGAR